MENIGISGYIDKHNSSKIELGDDNMTEITIPENEISFSFSRSSGKGGQNVNKRSTKVQAHWNLDESESFSEEEKQKIRESRDIKNRISEEGVITISRQKQRTQEQNRKAAIDGLNQLVTKALIPKEERIPTKPTRSSREKRLEEKKHQKQKKESRSKKNIEYE